MDNERVEKISYKGKDFWVDVAPSEYCESPRSFDEPLFKIAAWHRNYDFDESQTSSKSEFLLNLLEEVLGETDLVEEFCEKNAGIRGTKDFDDEIILILEDAEDGYVMLPLYMLDHSGIALSLEGFAIRWDSGQVGWVYASKKHIMGELGIPKWSQEAYQKAYKVAEKEIQLYSYWIEGATFEVDYSLEEDNLLRGCEVFYGYPEDHKKTILKNFFDLLPLPKFHRFFPDLNIHEREDKETILRLSQQEGIITSDEADEIRVIWDKLIGGFINGFY